MLIPAKAAAAVAATMAVTTAAAAAWRIASPGRTTPPVETRTLDPSPRSEASEGPDKLTVCVGPPPDQVLRATRPDGTCPEGHRELKLEEKDERVCDLCDPDKLSPSEDPPSDPRLAALDERIRSLEQSAYFEVITPDGRPIFRVERGGARMFNAGGMAVAAIGTPEGGGYFVGRSAGSADYASIGASGTRAGVRLLETSLPRLELKVQDGRSSFKLPSKGGMIAGIGESTAGSGTIVVGTFGGRMRAAFTVPYGRGHISTNPEGESGGTALLEPGIGGGMFGLDDTRGNAAVKMGHNGNRYGIVLAGPVLGFPWIPKSGLPGSYFVGCASDVRPACVPAIDP